MRGGQRRNPAPNAPFAEPSFAGSFRFTGDAEASERAGQAKQAQRGQIMSSELEFYRDRMKLENSLALQSHDPERVATHQRLAAEYARRVDFLSKGSSRGMQS